MSSLHSTQRHRASKQPRRSTLVALALLALLLLWWSRQTGAKESSPALAYRVIVHADNQLGSASREFLANAFLKRVTRWEDGKNLYPVDLPADSSVRRRFSRGVLRRSVEAVRNYWQQQIFSGRGLPPPELDSEEAVVRYVSRHRGGIGYVGGDTELDGVRVLTVR